MMFDDYDTQINCEDLTGCEEYEEMKDDQIRFIAVNKKNVDTKGSRGSRKSCR